MTIYLAITVDTECDKGEKWRVKQPLSFKNTREGVVNNLQPIFDRYGVRATYLLSPEVINDALSVKVFKELSAKVELGTHLHSEFIEPLANFNTNNTDHYQADFSEDIEFQKLQNLTTLFVKTFGYNPTSFRAGRFGISQSTMKHLEDLKYLVDSSVTPDMQWKNSNGSKVNFFGAPYQPYHPKATNFKKSGNMKIIQFPVTLFNPKLLNIPKWLKRRIKLNNRFQNIAFNFLTGFSKPLWLRPTYSTVDEMINVTNSLAKKLKNRDLYLCMMFHSV